MNLSNVVEEYCTKLRGRQIQGSFACAKKTAEVMRLLITTQRHSDAASLIDDVRTVGTKLQAAKPVELAVGNIVRRVLHMIREEQQQERLEQAESSAVPGDTASKQQVILTYGMSDTTFLFLKEASRKREFQVVVAEAAPVYDGHSMARELADARVRTTLIADSAVFAMMARANKVLVGAHAVLANGGVIAPAGVHMVALAAKRHQVPFVVLIGLHKLSPLFPHDPDVTFNVVISLVTAVVMSLLTVDVVA
eukprot:gene7212-7426_t